MEKNKSPFDIIKSRYFTEKVNMLASLKDAQTSASIKKFNKPKYVFLVDPKANKKEIKWAIENIYEKNKIKVVSVNTITIHPKKKRSRGHVGKTNLIKKAIVTLEEEDILDEQI